MRMPLDERRCVEERFERADCASRNCCFKRWDDYSTLVWTGCEIVTQNADVGARMLQDPSERLHPFKHPTQSPHNWTRTAEKHRASKPSQIPEAL